ncbi:MAG: DUF805 domain-containing protein [Pseudomonadota bacterium]
MRALDRITGPYAAYATFSGRATRTEYWSFAAFAALSFFALLFIVPMLGLIFLLATFVPGTALAVRRLHDSDRSGYWMLLPGLAFPAWLFVFIASAASALAVRDDPLDDDIYFLIATVVMLAASLPVLAFLAAPPSPGDNAFGPEPNGGEQ